MVGVKLKLRHLQRIKNINQWLILDDINQWLILDDILRMFLRRTKCSLFGYICHRFQLDLYLKCFFLSKINKHSHSLNSLSIYSIAIRTFNSFNYACLSVHSFQNNEHFFSRNMLKERLKMSFVALPNNDLKVNQRKTSHSI